MTNQLPPTIVPPDTSLQDTNQLESKGDESTLEGNEELQEQIEPLILFRNVCPTDLTQIYSLEKASYPPDEAASRKQIQYRQHHAATFFRCAVLIKQERSEQELEQDIIPSNTREESLDEPRARSLSNFGGESSSTLVSKDFNAISSNTLSTHAEDNRNSLNGLGEIVGYISATRCHTFDEDAMKAHDPTGKLLAIHSVVVAEKYRNRGIGRKMMLNYLDAVEKMMQKHSGGASGRLKHPIEKVVLITKMQNVRFYLSVGFSILGKSKICHGKDQWYDCEIKVASVQNVSDKEQKYECWIMDSFAVPHNFGNLGNSGSLGYATDSVGVSMSTDANPKAVRTLERGTGNPAAVVMIHDGGQIETEASDGENEDIQQEFDPALEQNQVWMKVVAREFHLSETAFIWKRLSGVGVEYGIRFYTCDGTEVDLCGHATLAAASAVFEKLSQEGKRDLSVAFYGKRDVLKAKPATGGSGSSKIIMEFPTKKTVLFESGSDDEIAAKLMIKNSLFSSYKDDDFDAIICQIGLDDGGDDLLVEITMDAFFALLNSESINFSLMKAFDGYKRGIIVCCAVPEDLKKNGERADFFSRFFGPKVGINEDPVTGSAHCILGPYFGSKLQKDYVVGMQKSERGGIVECTMVDDGFMKISGSVVKAVSGYLYI
jgi:PhzF family phenazine biosynthesis protein